MAAKIFEVGDVLPATTQLRISWVGDITNLGNKAIKSANGNFELIYTSSWYVVYINITMAPLREVIYDGITYQYVDPYTDYTGSHAYIDIDTSTWPISYRTIHSMDSIMNIFTWEDVAPSGYTITFNSNGGTSISDIEEATVLPTPLPTPTKSGYTFVAWYYESNFQTRAVAGATIEENTTLYAKWHTLGSLFTEIADAIRSKDGTSENIRDVDFGERVKQIQPAKEEQSKTVSPSTSQQVVTPDSGKVLNQVTVNAIPTETKSQQPNLSSGNQTINATSGKFMTSFTITKDTTNHIASNIRSGKTLYGVTGNLQPAKEEETKTVTPNFSSGNVVVTPTSGKVMTQVTINKDGNLIADNIKSGVTIFGITGTYEGEPSGFTLAIVCDCSGYSFSYPLYYSIDDGTNWVYIADTAASYSGTVNLSNITQIKFKLYIDYGYEDGCWLKVGTTVGGSDLYNGTGQYTLSELISPNIPITSNTTLYVSSFGAD